MAQLDIPATGGGSRRLARTLRIDMTPMVDLGFLLITFFIFTTTISAPKTLSLSMPKESKNGMAVKERNALTLLLDRENRVFGYEGIWENAVARKGVLPTTYDERTGIGQWIRNKQKALDALPGGDRQELVLLIKASDGSSYTNVIDAIDEAVINGVKNYVVLSPSEQEALWMKK